MALIVAPFLPFATAAGGFLGSASGIELIGPEAFISVVAGILIAAPGFQHASGAQTRRRVPLVASLVANGLTAWYLLRVSDLVHLLAGGTGLASVGTGLWLAVAGSVVSFFVVVLKS